MNENKYMIINKWSNEQINEWLNATYIIKLLVLVQQSSEKTKLIFVLWDNPYNFVSAKKCNIHLTWRNNATRHKMGKNKCIALPAQLRVRICSEGDLSQTYKIKKNDVQHINLSISIHAINLCVVQLSVICHSVILWRLRSHNED